MQDHDLWESGSLANGSNEFEMPFGEPALDYSFVLPEQPHPIASLELDESEFLEARVTTGVIADAVKAIPKWIKLAAEANAFLDAWYRGWPQRAAEDAARQRLGWHVLGDERFVLDELIHPIFDGAPAKSAHYLVGCARAGAIVFGESPVARYCAEHLYSRWPEQLFARFGEQFKAAARELQSPAFAFSLPPLVQLVLSRAEARHHIPEVIRDLRDELSEPREELWQVLRAMWRARTFREQLDYLRTLQSASDAMFDASFPSKIDLLNIGITAAPLSVSAIAGTAKLLRDRDLPMVQVGSVSFASRLSMSFRRELLNSEAQLKRYLKPAELKSFGLA
ncbi:MAG: hypothetical protein KF863_23260 [Rubrivivax sp.]|nr:hypothetical protein [Rubrivivax sp.]